MERNGRRFRSSRRLGIAAALAIGALSLVSAPAALADGGKAASTAKERSAGKKSAGKNGKKRQGRNRARARRRQAQRLRRLKAQRLRRAKVRRIRRANRSIRLYGNSVVARPRAPKADSSSDDDGIIDAGFENGLDNWNTAGVGEVIPTVATGPVRSGSWSGRFALSGDQDRSELILGGDGDGSADDAVRFYEGDEHWYAFSFYIESMVYGEPGAHNLIMQFKGTDGGSPYFGLQLWDYEGDDGEAGGRGLWSHGEGMDGDRFLSPVAERQWHDIVVHFKASSQGAGFYELFLNGQPIDSASGVSMIPSDASHAYIKGGLYRNGSEIPGTSEVRLDAARLGPSASAVDPG